jgi:ParB-like chromosome segregation protein Spo0J
VIAGGRHLVAARRAGTADGPVVVRNADCATVRILQLLENLQRQELSPTDEARAYQELMDLQGLTPPKIALRVRRHEQHVRDRLRLLRDQLLSDAVERRQISATVAREINKLPDEIAERLRQRVQEGAKLLQKDIDETRAHMARDGIVHPRLAPRADRMPEPVLEGEVGASVTAGRDMTMPTHHPAEAHDTFSGLTEETALPRWLDVDQHHAVHSDKEAFHRIQHGYQRLRASLLPHDPPAGPGTAAPAPVSPGLQEPAPDTSEQGRSPSDMPAGATLAKLLVDLDLRHVRHLLLYGIERGMSCAGLWQHIQDLAAERLE